MRAGIARERTGDSGEPHRRFALGDRLAEAAGDNLAQLARRLVVLRWAARVLSILPVRDDRLGVSRHGVGDRGGGDHERVDREPGADHDAQDPGAPEGIPWPDEAREGEA